MVGQASGRQGTPLAAPTENAGSWVGGVALGLSAACLLSQLWDEWGSITPSGWYLRWPQSKLGPCHMAVPGPQ